MTDDRKYWANRIGRRATRRQLLGRALTLSAGAAALVAVGCGSKSTSTGTSSSSQKYTDPGISDTEIKIGNTFSYSGPNAVVGQNIGGAIKAYFQYINETKNGVNGRKITFNTYDDGYDAGKALENTRRAVEQDQVFTMAFVFGTPMVAAILPYVGPKQVPILMPLTALHTFDDPKKYPSLVLSLPSYIGVAKAVGEYVAKTYPDAKVGLLTQNGDPGPDFVTGIKVGLGNNGKAVVDAQTTLPTDPSDDAQVEHLKASGATVWYNQAPNKQSALALKHAYDIGWRPPTFVATTNNSTQSLLSAGAEAVNGIITTEVYKDPQDPQWQNDPAMTQYKSIVTKYQPQTNVNDPQTVSGFTDAKMLEQFLSQMKEPTRNGLMAAIRSTKGYTTGLELPGITVNGSNQTNFLITQYQLARFDSTAQRWTTFGQVLSS